jgi:hypothetical protein
MQHPEHSHCNNALRAHLCDCKGSLQVDIQHLPPLLQRDELCWSNKPNTCVVHEQVEAGLSLQMLLNLLLCCCDAIWPVKRICTMGREGEGAAGPGQVYSKRGATVFCKGRSPQWGRGRSQQQQGAVPVAVVINSRCDI